MARLFITRFALVVLVACALGPFATRPVVAEELGRSEFVDSDGVKLHCVTQGKGPLLVMIHGFPDFWYTWRNQMPALAEHFQVVAYDQRGYNLSDKPAGVENYTTDKLLDAMLNYYKANYPREPYAEADREFPQVQCPVLLFHGLKDPALLPGALGGTWDWVANELTLIALPEAGHFVQHDAADVVTRRMVGWLMSR
ncbi:MAG: alpha/beta fold hydrolase [Pirellulaceae bacterium]|nr:alpha/beta fold hydrolase [Pirellulaceae bacterium]